MDTRTVHHVSISVADLDAQHAFYREGLGLELVVERLNIDHLEVRTLVLQAEDGLRIELIERAGSVRDRVFSDPLDAVRNQGYGHWALSTADLQRSLDRLVHAGASVVVPPSEAVRPGDRYAYVADPEGNLLELIQESAG